MEKTQEITMKVLILPILVFSLFTFATAYYPGEIVQYNITGLNTYSNWTIEGNTSLVNISVENLTAYIQIPVDYEPGNFTVYFNGYNPESVPVSSGWTGGGGGHYTRDNLIKPSLPSNENKPSVNASNSPINDSKRIDKESKGLFSNLWNWLVNLFRRIFG